jgi:hypothetical protein
MQVHPGAKGKGVHLHENWACGTMNPTIRIPLPCLLLSATRELRYVEYPTLAIYNQSLLSSTGFASINLSLAVELHGDNSEYDISAEQLTALHVHTRQRTRLQ